MIQDRVKPLLDAAAWQGKIFSNGWQTARGGTADVTDKSTGESLGRTGVANAADIAEAAKRAKAALPACGDAAGRARGDPAEGGRSARSRARRGRELRRA